MSSADWLASLALIVSGAALALEIRRWVESGVRLKLRVMADAKSFPIDDGKEKLVLIVANFGNMPTTITHMIAQNYSSIFHRILRRTRVNFLMPSTDIQPLPHKLEVAGQWIAQANYNEELEKLRLKGGLFVGILCTHRGRSLLVKVPRKDQGQKELSP